MKSILRQNILRQYFKGYLAPHSQYQLLTKKFAASAKYLSILTPTRQADSDGVISEEHQLRSVRNDLIRIDSIFRSPRSANSDEVLKLLKNVNDGGKCIPLAFFFDAISLYARRNDVIRTELLLRLASKNMEQNPDVNLLSSQSRPQHRPFDKLASFAVAELIKQGHIEDAMNLWMRMSSSGYVTSRISLDKLLDKICTSGTNQVPSIEFLDKIHEKQLARLWHQSPQHYQRVFGAYRQYITWSCKDPRNLAAVGDRIEHLWKEYQELLNARLRLQPFAASLRSDIGAERGTDVEVNALVVQCWLALLAATQKMQGLSKEEKDTLLGRGHNAVQRAFRDLLGKLPQDRIINASRQAEAETVTRNHLEAVDSILSKLGSPSQATTAEAQALVSTDSANFVLTRATGTVRNAVAKVLLGLAKDGLKCEVLELLGLYLEVTHSGEESEGTVRRVTELSGSATARPYHPAKSSTMTALAAKAGLTALRAAPRASASMFTMHQQAWEERLIADILRSLRVEAPGIVLTQEQRINAVEEFARDLIRVAKGRVYLGPMFFGAWVEAYRPPQDASGGCRVLTRDGWDWKMSLSAGQRVLDALEDPVGRSALAQHAIVSLLCAFADPEASEYTLRLVAHEMSAERISALPKTWACILDAYIAYHGDTALRHVLSTVEDRMSNLIANAAASDRPTEVAAEMSDLLVARLRGYCRLREGYTSLQLVQSIRNKGISLSRRVYSWVMTALYMSMPSSEKEWRLVKDPTATCEWLLREMHRDGLVATSATAVKMLGLHGKACQIFRSQGNVDVALQAAEAFLSNMCKALPAEGGHAKKKKNEGNNSLYMGHPRVQVSEEVLREMVKVYCLAGKEEQALAFLETMEERFGVKPSALSYDPLLFYYALRGRLTLVEDVLMMMVSRGVSPSDSIADAFLTCATRRGGAVGRLGVGEALDRVQELYTTYGIRPSATAMLRLIDAALEVDVHEARRAVVVVEQIYSPEERIQAVYYPNHWIRFNERKQEAAAAAADADAPPGQALGSSQGRDLDLELNEDGMIPGHRLGRGVVPAEYRALTREALGARFAKKGLSLDIGKKKKTP